MVRSLCTLAPYSYYKNAADVWPHTVSTEGTILEDTFDNIPSPARVEKPIIQEFVPPTLNKFRQKKTKGKARRMLSLGLSWQKGI